MGFKRWVNSITYLFRDENPATALETPLYPEVLDSDPQAPKGITKAPKKAPATPAKKVRSTTAKTKTTTKTATKPAVKKTAAKKPVANKAAKK